MGAVAAGGLAGGRRAFALTRPCSRAFWRAVCHRFRAAGFVPATDTGLAARADVLQALLNLLERRGLRAARAGRTPSSPRGAAAACWRLVKLIDGLKLIDTSGSALGGGPAPLLREMLQSASVRIIFLWYWSPKRLGRQMSSTSVKTYLRRREGRGERGGGGGGGGRLVAGGGGSHHLYCLRTLHSIESPLCAFIATIASIWMWRVASSRSRIDTARHLGQHDRRRPQLRLLPAHILIDFVDDLRARVQRLLEEVVGGRPRRRRLDRLLEEQRVHAHPLHRPEEHSLERGARALLARRQHLVDATRSARASSSASDDAAFAPQ